MPNSTQLAYFAAFLGSGVLFLVLAFTLFLPVIMLAPSKFAICFTIGSVLVLSAFVSLRGWRHQLTHMLSADRLLFTLGKIKTRSCVIRGLLWLYFSSVMSVLCKCMNLCGALKMLAAAYAGSMAGTLYAALSLHSYVLSLVFCAAQVRSTRNRQTRHRS